MVKEQILCYYYFFLSHTGELLGSLNSVFLSCGAANSMSELVLSWGKWGMDIWLLLLLLVASCPLPLTRWLVPFASMVKTVGD